MQIIKPSTVFYGEVPTEYKAAVQFVEMCGRLCYKSEDKITEGSAEKFVRKLIKAGHLAMLEHSSFVIRTKESFHHEETQGIVGPYLKVHSSEDGWMYIGGSLTAWFQAGTPNTMAHSIFDPFYLTYGDLFNVPSTFAAYAEWQVCPHDEIPRDLHRYAVKFICDRGVSHELVRHRPCSFAQESTRYVNYGGKDMEFIEPAGFEEWDPWSIESFGEHCRDCERLYAAMLRRGLIPQQARAVLPNALKTEIVTTADLAEWRHIFSLRCAPSAHPDFVRLAVPLRDKFKAKALL